MVQPPHTQNLKKYDKSGNDDGDACDGGGGGSGGGEGGGDNQCSHSDVIMEGIPILMFNDICYLCILDDKVYIIIIHKVSHQYLNILISET